MFAEKSFPLCGKKSRSTQHSPKSVYFIYSSFSGEIFRQLQREFVEIKSKSIQQRMEYSSDIIKSNKARVKSANKQISLAK